MKGVPKLQVASFLFGVLVIISGILILVLSSGLLKDWIIIGYGVRALGPVRIVGVVVMIVGAIFTLVRGMSIIKMIGQQKQQQKRRELSEKAKSRVLNDYAQDSENPEFTRRRLKQLRTETPELENLVERCFDQMDAMDNLQEKQKALIEANDARYLKDTVVVLDNVERHLCRNFRNIVNLCIAAESVKQLDVDKVERRLMDNQKKLDNAKELLRASADWINQYDTAVDGDRSEVENWIAVIRDSLKEE